jgi:hypothetical protein
MGQGNHQVKQTAMIAKNELPVEYYLDLIRENKPFSLSRFGDGEILCMFHVNFMKQNCDGSRFIDELIEPMKQIFRNQYKYFHCLLDCSFDPVLRKSNVPFRKFIEATCPQMPFFNGEIWQAISFSGRITELTNVLAPYNPCFIGAEHIEKLVYIDGFEKMMLIEIPQVDAFYQCDSIYESILKTYAEGQHMFCFCAGYTTKILIDRLFPVIGHDAFMIDFGSVFDPYCGVLSRSGMINHGFELFQPFTSYKLEQ